MASGVEILEPSLHAVLLRGEAAAPGVQPPDAFRAPKLMDRLLGSPATLRSLRRGSTSLGIAPWFANASDPEFANEVARAIRCGRLLIHEIVRSEPEVQEGGPDHRPINMKAKHILAFQQAAAHYSVYILVRETNAASLQHMGEAYAVPKPLDCKPKTADFDVHLATGMKNVAGLVVDPTIVGQAAFGPVKYAKALHLWESFAKLMIKPEVATLQGQRSITYLVGGRYFVDLDPSSPRYGALKVTPTGLLTAGKYIHGDFDLYGIVPLTDPSSNIRVVEERLGNKHARSPEFFDVQHYVNRTIGVPMVQHGAEESYSGDFSDDKIDIFHPDGRITCVKSTGELAALYRSLFKGRKLFTKDGAVDLVRGSYVKAG